MATQDVQILKQSGIIAVRYANGNLRIPGFKLLEQCNTTVDMDQDPEVYMMLEPIIISRNLNKATPNADMRNSARRLRFIFKAVILFFQWRKPGGEKMLREYGIDNLPNEVFEEIKAALVQTDGHFSRFSAMAIKRCLQLFTANVMDHARTALPTAKGDTTARDLAREAWESVRTFQAMLTQDWATIADPNDPPTAGPSTAGPSTAGPSGVPSHNAQQSTLPTLMDETSPFFAGTSTGDRTVVADQETPTPVAPTRGRGRGGGRGRGRGGRQLATRGRGGPTALKPLPRGARKSGPSRQDDMNLDGHSSPTKTPTSQTTPEKRVTRSAKASPASVLGKHPRAELDIDEAKASRPADLQKQYDKSHAAVRAGPGATEAVLQKQYNKFRAAVRAGPEATEAYLEKLAEKRDTRADSVWVLNASHQQLACEVIDLRRHVRALEKEKKEALANQRQQLRPGLVTMKMTPRVQQRVNQLFPPTGNDAGGPSKAPGSHHMNLSRNLFSRSGRNAGIETWLDHVENEVKQGDFVKLPSTPRATTLGPEEEELKTGPGLPPVGYFRHPTPTKSTEMPKSKHLSTQTTGPKKWPWRRANHAEKRWDYFDSDDESEVPTESSWASAIPA